MRPYGRPCFHHGGCEGELGLEVEGFDAGGVAGTGGLGLELLDDGPLGPTGPGTVEGGAGECRGGEERYFIQYRPSPGNPRLTYRRPVAETP